MRTPRDPIYVGHRYPAEIISYAVWLYFRFPLGLRMVEEMLAARGISVTHETIRQWGLKFDREFAGRIRQRAPLRGDKWHLDEVVISIVGKKHGSVANSGSEMGSASTAPHGCCDARQGSMWVAVGQRGYPRSITSSRSAMPRRGPSNEDRRRPAPYAIRPWALIASNPERWRSPSPARCPVDRHSLPPSGKTDRQGSIFLCWLRPRSSSP